jgi:hypothetical protein
MFYDKLKDITNKLNISEKLLNETIRFFLNEADQSDENVVRINIAYEKLCEVGVKR